MDGSTTHRPQRRWRLLVLLLLGAVGLAALAVARLSPSQPERAEPRGGAEERARSAADAGEPDRRGAAAEGEPPNWQLVAAQAGGARAFTAAELTAELVAECAKGDPKSVNYANTRALRTLIREKSEAEILGAAAALLECRTVPAVQEGSTIALGVLGGDGRRITDDEAYAIVGDAAARILTELRARTPLLHRNPIDTADSLDTRDIEILGMRELAAGILVRIGSRSATEVVLASGDLGGWARDLLPRIRNPASVPLLFQALLSRTDLDPVLISVALCHSAEGRAELRRLLDPAGGFHWGEHGGAKTAALRVLATGFREAADLAAMDAALQTRPDIAKIVTGAVTQHGRGNPLSDAALALPTKTQQAGAIVGFLAGHEGSPLEPSLLAVLARFPERIVDPLLPRLEAARPGTRERILEARNPAK